MKKSHTPLTMAPGTLIDPAKFPPLANVVADPAYALMLELLIVRERVDDVLLGLHRKIDGINDLEIEEIRMRIRTGIEAGIEALRELSKDICFEWSVQHAKPRKAPALSRTA